MTVRAKKSALHKAFLVVAPLVLLTYGGVAGWLYVADMQDAPEVAHADPKGDEASQPPPTDSHAKGDEGHSDDQNKAKAEDHGDAKAGSHSGEHSDGHGGDTDQEQKPDAGHAQNHKPEDGHGAPPAAHSEAPAADGHGQSAKAQVSDGHDTPKDQVTTAPGSTHGSNDTHGTHADTKPAATESPATVTHAPTTPRPDNSNGTGRRTPAPQPAPVAIDTVTLAPAPDPELETEGRHGPLPIRAASGRSPWQVYGRPFERQRGQRLIAIVITELGLAEAATLSAIQDLPGEVTLAFTPYSRRLPEWVPGARAAGHEVLLHVPMEPRNLSLSDPGDRALLVDNAPEINKDNLEWVLSRATGYVGVTSFMGSRLTVSDRAMRPILEELGNRGLAYVDARVTPLSVAGKLSLELGLPTAINDRFIDPQAARAPIDARLAELEQIALSQGSAIGFAQAYPVTIERLLNWLPGMKRRGFRLAPLTAVISR